MLFRRVEGDHAFKEWKRDASSHRAKGMTSVDQPRLSPNVGHSVFPSFYVFWNGKKLATTQRFWIRSDRATARTIDLTPYWFFFACS